MNELMGLLEVDAIPSRIDLEATLRMWSLPSVITDPNLPDNPIIFVNDAFLKLTGYARSEVIGQNCRFLQGKDTEPESIAKLRDALENNKLARVDVINYRKDGTAFVNALQIGPVADANGKVLFHLGSQLDVTEARAEELRAERLAERELLHRMRNIVNVMTSVIKLTARETPDRDEYVTVVTGRLRALSDAHLRTLSKDAPAAGDVRELTESVVQHYTIDPDVQLAVAGEGLNIAPQAITPLSLVLHELSTNAVKYGALSCREGGVSIDWSGSDDGESLVAIWRESGGPEVATPSEQSGSAIVRQIVAGVGGSLVFDWRPEGVMATITVPRAISREP